jgi:PKD repeat protein
MTVTNATVQAKSGSMEPGEPKAIAPVAASIRLSSEPVAGESAMFTAPGPNDSATSYKWDFDGDGTTDATGRTVRHTFESNGPQVVSLSVPDDDGAIERVSKTIMVKASGDDPPSNDILSLITSPPAPTVITVTGFLTAILLVLGALSARYRS